MTTFKFSTPSMISDFAPGSQEQALLEQNWNIALTGYTKAAVVSNPWTVDNQAPCSWYIDPTVQELETVAVEPIFWTAFPNRLKIYLSSDEKSPYKLDNMQVFAIGDYGNLPKSQQFETGLPYIIPAQRCPSLDWTQPINEWKAYDPNGPRGWLDEYCEWAVTRNEKGQITRIDFTCENPEYWYTLWNVSPEKVLELYHQLVSPNIKIEDLYLPKKDGSGFVIDQVTGREAYNPLNKWNCGTIATPLQGGAVHLTSPPNTIGAEIMLAAQATILRDISPVDYNMQTMVCKGAYGRAYRNSDPHIGLQANQLVKNLGVMITLTNPLGLYIQAPDFSSYKTPDGTDPSTFYNVIRGTRAGENGAKYDQILHARFEVPEHLGYTVSDILIGNTVAGSSQKPEPILFAGQIAETFHVCLAGTGLKAPADATKQTPLPPVADKTSDMNGQGIMFMSNEVMLAMLDINPYPPFVQLPTPIKAGTQLQDMALQVNYNNDNFKDAIICFCNEDGTVDNNISIKVTDITTASGVPAGSSSSSDSLYNYILNISVSSNATKGLKGVTIQNPNCATPIALPGILNII
ncbi:hypothetical protein [Marinicellulosiphila megalodicopiae]|uniref:hypothetical protein n=1 Tax=Marinicellulosiphila megalodicopiae TaxID=2724896 RepID=UPI003BB13726